MAWTQKIRNAPPMRQLAIAGAVLAILSILLIAAYGRFFQTSYEVLFSRLRAADAASIVAELDRRKIPYRLSDGGGTILVPSGDVDTTRLSVMSSDVPLKGAVGFELFNKTDMGLTDFAQKINYQRALQGELARTIMTLAAVESARVHLALTEPTIFRGDKIPPKASVIVTMRPGEPLAPSAVTGIQRLIAASVPELDAANVVILDESGRIVSSDSPPAPVAVSPVLQEQQAVAAYYEAHIRQALAGGGLGDVVDVSVRMATTASAAATDMAGPRQYGLAVTLSPHRRLTETTRADIFAIVSSAISADPTLGDTLVFGPQPVQRYDLPPPGPSLPQASRITEAAAPPPQSVGFLWPAVAIGGLVMIAAWSLRRRRSTPPAGQDYASKFNRLLDEDDLETTHSA